MYDAGARKQVISIFAQMYGPGKQWKDSDLLRWYTTLKAMRETQIVQPDMAHQTVIGQFSTYKYGYASAPSSLSLEGYNLLCTGILCFSYLDFLTYVVPGLVCDPKQTLDLFQRYKPGISCVERTHHIMQIKLLASGVSSAATKKHNANSGDSSIDQLYDEYLLTEKADALSKEYFSKLYLAITAFEMAPNSLLPKAKGAGFKRENLEQLMQILTDELQMTRDQQLDMLAEFFIKKAQARQIVSNQKLYNFTACKDETTRIKHSNKALRLISKIPPSELICAISVRKKMSGRANAKRKTEALILPNDVMLETGFVYPTFRNLIGPRKEAAILLIYPSVHFVRKLWADETMRDRNLTLVMQDERVASLLRYQVSDKTYAIHFHAANVLGPTALANQIAEKSLHYEKIVLFVNHLPMDQQPKLACGVLEAVADDCDIYALLSSYAIDDTAAPYSEVFSQTAKYMQAISVIPQGINNSAFPRRKLWVHFKKEASVSEEAVTWVYTYALSTALQTQALCAVPEAPMEIPRHDVPELESSIRKRYAQEIMQRRTSDRTRAMPFEHEITPDIPVWCSRTFPKGEGENPRLEAYVCLPPSGDEIYRGFSERGSILQSTKKHTTSVPQSDVLRWLEQDYPFSYVQQRYTRTEREQLNTDQLMKPAVSIREEIIEHFSPVLEGKNIALKTLWYLYPNLQNAYTGSDYNVLSQMMQTMIGQQRVQDITSELCEELLLQVYPDFNEAALWRNYTILSVAMEKAVQYKYCTSNPLADALHEEKLRRKLFAQVRKQLVKKHLNKNELEKAYASVIAKLQSGQHHYLGVLIRLLTGLESGIVCALRWGDLYYFADMDVMTFVITRQVSSDGKKLSGFSDKEDYMLFPLPVGLRDMLADYQCRLGKVSEKESILGSVMRLCAEGNAVDITPADLNESTKVILRELNVRDRTVDLAYGENEFRKTNLNKYMGDLMRENFRYWAMKGAKLHPDELAYLLRNRVATTCGRFYCNLQDEASLAILAAKLTRVECMLMQSAPPTAYRKKRSQVYQHTDNCLPKNGYRLKVAVEIDSAEAVELCAYSPRGVNCETTELFEKVGDTE